MGVNVLNFNFIKAIINIRQNGFKALDLGRQSLPFVYFYINVTSNDGNTHDVRLYSDITAGF